MKNVDLKRSFVFGPNGSTTADGNNTYAYDTRGRMVQATSSLGVTTYQVNALGQRIRKTNSLGDSTFHYDFRGKLISEAKPTTGQDYLWPMDALAVKPTEGFIRSVDLNWRIAGTGDLDGDGKADILWRNSATGENYIFFMNGTTIRAEGFLRQVDLNWKIA